MASLVDIARAMDKEKREEPNASKSTISLVDIARERQDQGAGVVVKPLTLLDVARDVENTANPSSEALALSLSNLAEEINKEERDRIDAAITKTAAQVKTEKAQERASALKVAANEVLEDESREAAQEGSTVPKKQSPVPSNPVKAQTPPKPTQDDDDGYSSFEDDEKEKTNGSERVVSKKPQRKVAKEEDNQSDSVSTTGPHRSTPSDSPQAKEFLRAIYRGETRRVRDMMRDEDVDASSTDQHGWSALHWAASQGQTEILSFLLAKDARVDDVEHVNGWTALHLAVARDAVGCIKKLLKAGAQLTIQDAYGDTVHDLLKAKKGKKRERLLQLFESHRQ